MNEDTQPKTAHVLARKLGAITNNDERIRACVSNTPTTFSVFNLYRNPIGKGEYASSERVAFVGVEAGPYPNGYLVLHECKLGGPDALELARKIITWFEPETEPPVFP